MERFWDARAREDAYWFVDSRLQYGDPDKTAFWTGGEEALDRLLGALEVQLDSGDTVLDIGCGLGRLTRPLATRVANVAALDISQEMLSEAKRLNQELSNVQWIHGDGSSLRPVEDASIDLCISHVVFRHIPDPAITLGYVQEMGRVLRPGGVAAFEFSNDPTPHQGRLRLRDRLASMLGRAPRGVTNDAWLGSSIELPALEEVAAQAGMQVERLVGERTEFCATRLRKQGQ
jgi:SAM-dependent methyltransferase